jgi:Yip1 domain
VAVETPSKSNALNTIIDTIIAPKNAFGAIRNAPTWFWAFAVSIILAMVGAYLCIPANQHALAADWPNMVAKSPALAGMSSTDQQSALSNAQKFSAFGFIIFIFVVPIFNVIVAAIMALFNTLGRGEGTFGKYWAAACNIGVVSFGIGSILIAAIVLARGADSFSSPQAIQAAVPSLAMLAPGSSPKLLAFLNAFGPITLWTTGLSIVAMLTIGRVPKLQAWLTGIVLFLVPTLLAVAFAK